MLKAVLALALPIVAAAALFGRNAATVSSTVAPGAPAARSEARAPARDARPAVNAFDARSCRRGEELVIAADRQGHFEVNVDFGSRVVPMMVDTGATRVILPHEEAVRLALPLAQGDKVPVNTANGLVSATMVRADRLRIGPICLHNVELLVMPPGRLPVALLGMNVIRQLARFEMSRSRLVMAH